MNITRISIVFLLSIAMIATGVVITDRYSGEYNTTYVYKVSTEPISTEYDSEEATELSELSDAERKLLKDAFEKTDTFYHGATVEVERESQLQFQSDLDVLEIDGAPIVVSISEEVEREYIFILKMGKLVLLSGQIIAGFTLALVYDAKWNTSNNRSKRVQLDIHNIKQYRHQKNSDD